MQAPDLSAAEYYTNRELSWLEFNERVLQEGRCESVPLLERLKFLAIVSSNLDEFFMIRVGGLMQQERAGVTARDISGLNPSEQLDLISERAHRMVRDHAAAIGELFDELAEHDFVLHDPASITVEQGRFLTSYFESEVLPTLTPLAVEELEQMPILPGLNLNLALTLTPAEGGDPRHAIVPIPANLPRFVTLPADRGLRLAALEDLVRRNIGALFPDHNIVASAVFRITRDADVAISEDEADDLLRAVESAVRQRRKRGIVRLEVQGTAEQSLKNWLQAHLDVSARDFYEVCGLLDAAALMSVAARPGFEHLNYEPWKPQPPRDLLGGEDLFDAVQDHDVLLIHPYESFEPVVKLVQRAADDPSVLAIKQTLYRTSGDSPIVEALARAAENGKHVIVLVELKARFDEVANVNWARRMEDAGCHVIYGVAGLKTHAKALLIVRREPHGIRRYVHLSTGNYHSRTAKLYSDIGLMTSDPDIGRDASAFFNLLTGYSQEVGWAKFAIAPTGLRDKILELIEREIQASSIDQPGLIMAKMNSLQDKGVIEALYRASRAGVQIRLNVRGICCLRAGIEGISTNLDVVSIVDRYLEHARIFYFRNGGHDEVYLSSADWMERNLDRRLEILFLVTDPALKKRMVRWLRIYLNDNAKAWRLLPDGTYEPVRSSEARLRAQERLQEETVEAVTAEERAPMQFQPLRSNPQNG